jgi:hypothetical protein
MSALSSMSGLSRTTAMRVASLITAINVLVAVGFSVAGLVNPKWILPASYVPTEASFIFALYAAARTSPTPASSNCMKPARVPNSNIADSERW